MPKHIKIEFRPEEIRHILREDYNKDKPPTKKVKRAVHGEYLKAKWMSVMSKLEAEDKLLLQEDIRRDGKVVEFIGTAGLVLKYQSLENSRSGIRLLNVRKEGSDEEGFFRAVLFIPTGKERIFLNKLNDYLDIEKDTEKGIPRHTRLLNNLEDIKLTNLSSYWTSNIDKVPADKEAWYELWFFTENSDQSSLILNSIDHLVSDFSMEPLYFPERMILLVKANKEQLEVLRKSTPRLAEIRKPTIIHSDFLDLSPYEREEYVEELLERTKQTNTQVMISILDEGIHVENPLLKPFIPKEQVHSLFADNGSDLHLGGHGTLMAGVSLYDDLTTHLDSLKTIHLTHTISSMKIIPNKGSNKPELYGKITNDAVENIELYHPTQIKIYTMAVSTRDFPYLSGAPTSWSASVDQLVAGVNDGIRKLFIVAAGNIRGVTNLANYPAHNLISTIEDPAQSWNAITVGAYTMLVKASNDKYEVIANEGGLSPFSKTSYLFDKGKWPIKPEVVFEGGNAIKSGNDGFTDNDLSLLTTNGQLKNDTITTFNATSAASAKASWFAAKLSTAYPDFWPETIRGLIIHSAEWTEEMKSSLLMDCTSNEEKYTRLLKTCGYGVPDLNRAMNTVKSNVNLIIEEEIIPYYKKDSEIKTNNFHLHKLPWPVEYLQGLGDEQLSMRVTLSYYIEPSPGAVGWDKPYTYSSVPLRYELNGNLSKKMFIDNITRVNWPSGVGMMDKHHTNVNWRLGSQLRDKGSIHSDTWEGTATDLSINEYIAVYPLSGWWRYRKHLERYDNKIRYSLIVSLTCQNPAIDLLTPIEMEIATRIVI